MRPEMCLRAKSWCRLAVLVCVALGGGVAQEPPAAVPQNPSNKAAVPAQATAPVIKITDEAPEVPTEAAASEVSPDTASATPTPSKRARHKKISKAAALLPDPNSNRGNTHQDPIWFVGLVAAGLYHRRKRWDVRDESEWVRRAHYEPQPVLPLPQSFQVTNYSWTANVPGASISLNTSTPTPVPQPVAAPEPEVPRVLLVGGEPDWIRMVNDALSGDGTELQVCHAGQRAVDLMQHGRFDAVIVDAEATGDNSPKTIRTWLERKGMERRLIVTVKNNCSADTAARLDEVRALRLTRPCGAQDLQVMVRLAVQRRSAAKAN